VSPSPDSRTIARAPLPATLAGATISSEG